MSNFTPIIQIGFDRNGGAEFRVSSQVGELDLPNMNRLRAMIPVAISQAEQLFTAGNQKRNPAGQEGGKL